MSMLINPYWFPSSCPIAGSVETDDAYYYNVAFLVDADGQANGTSYATDESRHAHTFTYAGSAAVASNEFTFNGTTDYLQCDLGTTDNVLWTPGSRFTIELRGVKFDSSSGRRVLISSYEGDVGEECWVWRLDTGSLGIVISDDGTNDTTYAGYSWTPLTDGTAYDLTVTWDGTTIRQYIDGLFVSSSAYSGKPFAAKQPLRVGCDFDASAIRDPFDGKIRAVRFSKGIARWTNGSGCYTRPKLPYTTTQATTTDTNWDDVVLLLTAEDGGRIRDASPYDWPITVNGNSAVSTSVEPFADANSITFDGTGDYLSIPDCSWLELGANDFTLECFARHTVITAAHRYISKYTTTSDRSYSFGYRGDVAGDPMTMTRSSNGTGTETTINNNWGPSADTWYHTAYTRSGTTGRHFADGTQLGSDQTDSITYFNGTSVMQIGAYNSSGITNEMNGYLTEVRVTIGTARYTAGFTAPSAVLPRG